MQLTTTNSPNFKERLESLFLELGVRGYSAALKKDKDLLQWVQSTSSFSSYLPEQVYAILHPDQSHLCGKGNKRKFRTIQTGWNRCNDKLCEACLNESRLRSVKTNLERYGVENPMHRKECKEKMISTRRVRGSDEIATKKRKAHYLEKYGVDHYWKTDEGRAKRTETLHEKYGVANPSQSRLIQEKKKETALDRYGVDQWLKSSQAKEKIRETLQSRYGVDYISEIPEVRSRARSTMLDRYGAEYSGQSPELREKAKSTLQKRYGVDSPMQLPDFKRAALDTRRAKFFDNILIRVKGAVTPLFSSDRYIGVDYTYLWKCNTCSTEFKDNLDDGWVPRCPNCFPKVKSRGEEQVYTYLCSLISESKILRNSRSVIKPFELDFYIPELKLAIEFNGVYRHSEISGKKDKTYHLNKLKLCQAQGIRLIQILDIEWDKQTDICKSRIAQALRCTLNVIPARKTRVVELTGIQASTFLDDNHIQKSCNSKIRLGLEYNGQVVAVMTFGATRFNRKYKYELLRYCSKTFTTIVGGASKLLAHFYQLYPDSSLISYCDLRWGTGDLYQKLGFELKYQSQPNYWYFSKGSDKLESRLKYQKHRLAKQLLVFNDKLSEWENMKNNNYDRIWDCGNLVFVKE